eukprot:8040_1
MTTLCGYCVHIIVLWFTHHRWRYVSAQSCNSTFTLPVEAKGMQIGYTVDSNIVYLFGGMTGELANTPLSSIYKYNVNEDQYTLSDTSTPTTPFHTLSNNIVSVNDIMYFVGTPMFVNDPWPPNYAYAFDVATETWTVLSNPLNPAVYGCLTANDTHLFFIGGIMDANGMIIILNGIQTYDIVSNDWSYDTINDLPIDGWQLGYCAMMNDDIYVFGGEGADLEYLDIIYKWDGTWNNIGTLPQPLVYGIAVAHMDYIYIIGGMGSNYVPSRNIYVFDTTQDVITNTYQMVWGLEYPAAGVINNKLYIFGGLIATGGVSNDVKVCDILPTLPTQISTNPSRSPVLNPTNPTASPIRPTAAPIRPNTVDPTTSLQPTLAPSILPTLPPSIPSIPPIPSIPSIPSKSPVRNPTNPINPTASPLHPTTSLLPTTAPHPTPFEPTTPVPSIPPLSVTETVSPTKLQTSTPTTVPSTFTDTSSSSTDHHSPIPTQHSVSTTALVIAVRASESTGHPTVSPMMKGNSDDNAKETFLIFGYMFAGLLLGIIAICIIMCCKVNKHRRPQKYSINVQDHSPVSIEMAPRGAGFMKEDDDRAEANVNKPAQLVISDNDGVVTQTRGHTKQSSSRMEGESGETIEGMDENDKPSSFNRKLKSIIALSEDEDMDEPIEKFKPQKDVVTKGGLPRVPPPPPPRIIYDMGSDGDQEVIDEDEITTGQ